MAEKTTPLLSWFSSQSAPRHIARHILHEPRHPSHSPTPRADNMKAGTRATSMARLIAVIIGIPLLQLPCRPSAAGAREPRSVI